MTCACRVGAWRSNTNGWRFGVWKKRRVGLTYDEGMPVFLSNPYFYGIVVLGLIAMYPRVIYLIEREAAAPREVKPTLPQRFGLLIPGLAVFCSVFLFQDLWSGVALVVLFGVGYAVMIVWLRGARSS